MAVPVPVPKDSLFKLAVDLTKAAVETSPSMAPVKTTTPKSILDLPPEPPSAAAEAAKGQLPGVPLIKAKTVPSTAVPMAIVPVVIPLGLAKSILSKPTTGGGWQATMGDLQKALVKMAETPESIEYSHVLELTPALLAKLVDKATLYGGGGGCQSVMKSIVCLAVKQHPGQILGGE